MWTWRLSILLMAGIVSMTMSDCGVYLAPSTIPGAGLGLFAGKDFVEGERITHGDIVIPIVDIEWHNNNENFFWLWDEYTWGADSIDDSMVDESEDDDIAAASPGIGAALNCILGLVNIVDTYTKFDSAGLHRGQDPGAGAFTPYHDRGSLALRNISAGSELFINYGSHYFSTRPAIYGQVPLFGSFKRANRLMFQFHQLQSRTLKNSSRGLQDDLWKIIVDRNSRITNALPTNREDIDDLLPKGTAFTFEKRSQRTTEWLEQHGQCTDNIRVGQSTIPQAGRGAFANRFIPSGGLVAPAPLIHIPNKAILMEYDSLIVEDGSLILNTTAPFHQQLLLNYCFGHPDSDVLLSPYGVLVSLINHSPTKPNTRIVWSKEMRHPEWLAMTPNSMEMTHHSGLAFNFIALQDIEEGEEILIDYGSNWQAAWDNHVANWVPPPMAESYLSANERNAQVDSILLTHEEGGHGGDVTVWVHGNYVELEGHNLKTNSWLQVEILHRYVLPTTETRYRARAFRTTKEQSKTIISSDLVLWSLPRDAFVFEDVPYTRDHAMPWSFRHYIGIPDDIFPQAWKRDGELT